MNALQIPMFDAPEMRLSSWPWMRVHKGHERCRLMADRHYTRQSPGHPMWTRPGYNFVLYASDAKGEAVWCWWRPKWEAGQERKDKLRVLECTMFRRERLDVLASQLIRAAVAALTSSDAIADLRLEEAGAIDELITGVNSEATVTGRSRRSPVGQCYLKAGWKKTERVGRRADTWLSHPMAVCA